MARAGADLDARLRDACVDGDAEECGALLAAGADPNATNESGWTALMEAAYEGHAEIAAALLAAAADPNATGLGGSTALMGAANKDADRGKLREDARNR